MTTTSDQLSRTIKLDLDAGRADTVESARRLAGTYELHVCVGANIAASPTRVAALLTIVNNAVRAFAGGVTVSGDLDWPIERGWFSGHSARHAVTRLGGNIGSSPSPARPTIVIGEHDEPVEGSITVYPTWQGWSAGVVTCPSLRLAETIEHPVAGVAQGAIAVSEAFQHVRSNALAGRRDVGISLWAPGSDWRTANGPGLHFLPEQLWVLGLGHLGQAYLWTIGLLPYADTDAVEMWLQDDDIVVEANRSTGMLVHRETRLGALKTRVCAAALEELGFRTRLVERRFSADTAISEREPSWAIAGFDSPLPRRHLGTFAVAVDVGLGSDHDDYLGVHLHAFPAAGSAADVFALRASPPTAAPPAWATAATSDPCGVVQLADAAVGASFVGAFAASIAVAELLRILAGEKMTAVLSANLASLQHTETVPSTLLIANPGFTVAN